VTRKLAWFHLTNSYNSDGQWPPTLPEAPHIVHPFNYAYCFDNLLKADLLVAALINRKLHTEPSDVLEEILGTQQHLILRKAETILAAGTEVEREKAARARQLILDLKILPPCALAAQKIFISSEYAARANMLVEARRLVGGVLIEKT